jgi:hypothetical protein
MARKERRRQARRAAKQKAAASRPKPVRRHSRLKMAIFGGLLLVIAWWYGGKLVSDLREVFNRLEAERKAKELWGMEDERRPLGDGRIQAGSGEGRETSPDRIGP